MPIEYKTYGCRYKCGFKHVKNYNTIVEHEKKCWYNPDNNSCRTCSYEVYPYYDVVGKRLCAHPDGLKISSDDLKEMYIDENKIKPKMHCGYWKAGEKI